MEVTELARAFETCTFPPDDFHHREHVAVAWVFLREDPDRATERYLGALRRYVTFAGAEAKFDEALTRRYLALVAGLVAEAPALDFDRWYETFKDRLRLR